MPRRYRNQIFRVIVLLVGLWLSFDLVSHLVAEVLWFQEVGYLATFLLRLKTQLGLGVIALVMLGFLLGNLALAERLKHPKPSLREIDDLPRQGGLGLAILLPLTLGLTLLLGLMLLHYGQVAAEFWHATDSPELRLKTEFSFVQKIFRASFWQNFIPQHPAPQWQMGMAIALGITSLTALSIYPQFLLRAIALLMSLCFGLVLSGHWTTILLYFHSTSFNIADPLFQQDISFYVFKLPLWELVEFSLSGLFLV